MIIGTIFSDHARRSCTGWRASLADQRRPERARRPATSWPSRRSRAGSSSRWASCSTSRWRSRARSPCSTGSSSTSTSTRRSPTRRTRSTLEPRDGRAATVAFERRLVPLPGGAGRSPLVGAGERGRVDAEAPRPTDAAESTVRRGAAPIPPAVAVRPRGHRLRGAARASWSRSSARPARARPRPPTSSRGCTTSTRGAVEIDGVDVRRISAGVAGRIDRLRHPGDVPVPRLDPRQPAATPGRTRPTRSWRRRPRAAAIHDRIAELPDGLRHDRRRARLQALGRREAADRDRPGPAQGPADPDPRRGDVRARHGLASG